MTADIQVVDYQFPESHDQSWDADWLFVRLRLQVGDQRWERTDPAVTTFELQDLTVWLDQVAEHAQVFGRWQRGRLTTRLVFTEPNLGFEALSGHASGAPITLKLSLAAEFLPPFKAELSNTGLEDDPWEVWLDFGVDAAQLRALADELRGQLTRFPSRRERTSQD